MTRIWLNHWFSTAYNIIGLIRKNNPQYKIVGSNEHEKSPIMSVCDEWYREPIHRGDSYVDWCLSFCSEHSIDVFMPRRHMVSVSKRKSEFAELGVEVMVDDYDLVAPLNDKAEAYQLFKNLGVGDIPPYRVVRNVMEFEKAYREFAEDFDSICFKFVSDEGGKSYRRIDNAAKGYGTLFKKQTTRITFENACSALGERDKFPPLMVMPYLPDEEISVDCLMTDDGLIAIPRVKTTSRVERVVYDEAILGLCDNLLDRIPLQQPCNIQFKKLEGTPYLLEVNTRMSGGTHMSCVSAGVNIPSIAVNKLIGKREEWSINQKDAFVTQVEIPIALDCAES